MLQASMDEVNPQVPDGVHGLSKVRKVVMLLLDAYIIEPVCTGLRLIHLVVIFVPVIFAVPLIWCGARREDRGNERSGTLLWYAFLVNAMERAGPAFIKVGHVH
jgi:aarF domain-containing kinase